jgi:hypothetical protein
MKKAFKLTAKVSALGVTLTGLAILANYLLSPQPAPSQSNTTVLADVRRRDPLDHRRPAPRRREGSVTMIAGVAMLMGLAQLSSISQWYQRCWFKTMVVDVWNRWPGLADRANPTPGH